MLLSIERAWHYYDRAFGALKIFFSALGPLTKRGESALFGKIKGQAIVDELVKSLRISAGWRHHY